MANLKELRVRIGSIKNTRKITAAMSRIAAARLSRAQNAILSARPYGAGLRNMVADLLASIPPMDRPDVDPLLRRSPEPRTVWIVAMNADRGLCGGFNAAVHKEATKQLDALGERGVEVRLVCIGRKAQAYFTHFGRPILRFFGAPEPDTVEPLAPEVARFLMDAFHGRLEGDGPRPDEIRLVSNRFVSVLNQEVRTEILLPVGSPDPAPRDVPPPRAEPSGVELLRHLLPVFVENEVREAMLDSMAGEVAARRMAMDAATDNATELIADLTLEYNRERQAAITKELMEIIGGAEALAG